MSEQFNNKSEHLFESYNHLDLSGQSIIEKEFEGCSFVDCQFIETLFKRCKFIDCNFINCNLSLSRLDHSEFIETTFNNSKLTGIDWTKVAWPRLSLHAPISFQQCIINDCSFFGLALKQLVIDSCKAHDVDFREGDFSESTFRASDFCNSLFNNSNLSETDFTDACNYQIDIYNTNIARAKFSRYEAISLLDSLDIELVD